MENLNGGKWFRYDADNTLKPQLEWLLSIPKSWTISDSGLTIAPHVGSDLINSWNYPAPIENAPLYACPLQGDFTVTTKILQHNLPQFGDAGGITIWLNKHQWAKLCLERTSLALDLNIVSVVTNYSYSDDANNEIVSGGHGKQPAVYLRVTHKAGFGYGMHYSLDGELWRFVRKFVLADEKEHSPAMHVGIHVQAPRSHDASVTFEYFEITSKIVSNWRSGA